MGFKYIKNYIPGTGAVDPAIRITQFWPLKEIEGGQLRIEGKNLDKATEVRVCDKKCPFKHIPGPNVIECTIPKPCASKHIKGLGYSAEACLQCAIAVIHGSNNERVTATNQFNYIKDTDYKMSTISNKWETRKDTDSVPIIFHFEEEMPGLLRIIGEHLDKATEVRVCGQKCSFNVWFSRFPHEVRCTIPKQDKNKKECAVDVIYGSNDEGKVTANKKFTYKDSFIFKGK